MACLVGDLEVLSGGDDHGSYGGVGGADVLVVVGGAVTVGTLRCRREPVGIDETTPPWCPGSQARHSATRSAALTHNIPSSGHIRSWSNRLWRSDDHRTSQGVLAVRSITFSPLKAFATPRSNAHTQHLRYHIAIRVCTLLLRLPTPDRVRPAELREFGHVELPQQVGCARRGR
jgi:hypothetical protein